MSIQISVFLVGTFFISAVLGLVHPFKILPQNYISLATEAIIIVVADLFLVISNPSLTGMTQRYVGYSIVLIVSTYLCIFIISMVYTSVKLGIRYI